MKRNLFPYLIPLGKIRGNCQEDSIFVISLDLKQIVELCCSDNQKHYALLNDLVMKSQYKTRPEINTHIPKPIVVTPDPKPNSKQATSTDFYNNIKRYFKTEK